MTTKAKIILTIIITVIVGVTLFLLLGTASGKRALVDFSSDLKGGLNRVINVYTADGSLIASYKGKIDLEETEGGYIKFDLNGKRYIYYNCFVETIADIS